MSEIVKTGGFKELWLATKSLPANLKLRRGAKGILKEQKMPGLSLDVSDLDKVKQQLRVTNKRIARGLIVPGVGAAGYAAAGILLEQRPARKREKKRIREYLEKNYRS